MCSAPSVAFDCTIGELFSDANITAKRPGTGISPMQWDLWIGKPALRDYAVNELLE